MIFFLIKIFVWNSIHSFVMGLGLIFPSMLISNKNENPNSTISWGNQALFFVVYILLLVLLPFVAATATNIYIDANPGVTAWAYWLIAWLLGTTPLALANQEQRNKSGLGQLPIILTNIVFITQAFLYLKIPYIQEFSSYIL